jgi:hypothetical protein
MPGDIQTYIKLSSNIFRSEKWDTDFAFDRNSACFYNVTLTPSIRAEDYQALCRTVKEKYEAEEGQLQSTHEEIDLEAEIYAAVSPLERSSTASVVSNVRAPEPDKKGKGWGVAVGVAQQ